MKYKLFISDYDGTLGHAPQNDIDEETLSAIKKFIDKGGKFVVCSGRETTSISRILKNSGLKGLVASFQGARITDRGTLLDAGGKGNGVGPTFDELSYTQDGLLARAPTAVGKTYDVNLFIYPSKSAGLFANGLEV